MRVLHLISNLTSGGAESMLAKVVTGLPEHEHRVVTMLSGGLFHDELQRRGIGVVGLGMTRSMSAGIRLPAIRREIASFAPDVVQAWMYHANLAAVLASGGRPVVYNVRQGLSRPELLKRSTRLVIWAGGLLSRRARAIVYNSRAAAAEHERWGYAPARRVFIPNGFDLDRFRPDPEAKRRLCRLLGVGEETLIVGRVARYTPDKDDATLFAAFGRLLRPGSAGPLLVLVGKGMEDGNQALVGLAAQHGIAHRLRLLGERADIAELGAGFDLAVLSSVSEGFPNVLGEAMASGVPVVGTDVGEVARLVGDASLVVPVASPDALAAAMRRVLDLAPAERESLGMQGRARIERNYSLRRIAERYAALWAEVTEGRTIRSYWDEF